MIYQVLESQNPWWQDITSIDRDQHLIAIEGKSYQYTPLLVTQLQGEPGDIFIIRGPRQVGKTTALKMMIRQLLLAKKKAESIAYLSCESITDFKELIKILTQYFKEKKEKHSYFFLDEISFVPEWQRAILFCANRGFTQNATLVLTGSNARDLKESGERLPGRRGKGKDLELFPLTLRELPTLKCFKEKSFADLLDIYLHVGGFPRAIADFVTMGTVTDTTYEIYRNWIVGDASRYDLRQETLKQILFRIAQTMGTRITWPKLIENSPVKSHETALEYVEHLKDAFLCHLHYCYDPDLKGPAFQKARKIYFIDPLLYVIAASWREGRVNMAEWFKTELKKEEMRGYFFEAAVINHAARFEHDVFFWYSAKDKKEIDLLIKKEGKISLFEVKLSQTKSLKVLNREVNFITPQNFSSYVQKWNGCH